MARSANANKTKRVNISVTNQLVGLLEMLAGQGVYGATASEVARYFVQTGVATAVREGFLSLPSLEEVNPLRSLKDMPS